MEIEEAGAQLEASEARRAEIDAFLERARATVAHTREVIEATRELLGPRPGEEAASAE
ncbi:MAG TPA: hypothetical protein VF142_10830 [Longimicrobium sp.]